MVEAEINIGYIKIVWRQGLAVFSWRVCYFLCLMLEASGYVFGLCVTATVSVWCVSVFKCKCTSRNISVMKIMHGIKMNTHTIRYSYFTFSVILCGLQKILLQETQSHISTHGEYVTQIMWIWSWSVQNFCFEQAEKGKKWVHVLVRWTARLELLLPLLKLQKLYFLWNWY
jgi:hypothetical protein